MKIENTFINILSNPYFAFCIEQISAMVLSDGTRMQNQNSFLSAKCLKL